MAFSDDILDGINEGMNDLGGPTFNLLGTDYSCVPSVNTFTRNLEEGGFAIEKMLTMTVPLLDSTLNDIFTVLPTPQNIITYNGESFRIFSTHKTATGAYMRIIAHSTTKGI